jgi:hypothetical protein
MALRQVNRGQQWSVIGSLKGRLWSTMVDCSPVRKGSRSDCQTHPSTVLADFPELGRCTLARLGPTVPLSQDTLATLARLGPTVPLPRDTFFCFSAKFVQSDPDCGMLNSTLDLVINNNQSFFRVGP